MDETYDLWVDYGYDGWDYYLGLDNAELITYIDSCEKNDRKYFVYKTKDRQID